MKPSLLLVGLLALGFAAAGCNDDSPMAPTASSAQFTAILLPSNQVQAVTGDEANGSGVAALTFNLTKDRRGNVTAATLDVTVAVSGFPLAPM